jgi:DNA-binding response OmpR family regulator
MRVLIVEDQPKLAALLARGLREEGHAADVAGRGEDALWMAPAASYDAIVLDIMLPGIDGLETCRRLRRNEVWAPVLMLTARDAVDDRVTGLDAGADDYLTKPFSPRELVLRVTSVLRRSLAEYAPEAPFDLGAFTLHPSARFVQKDGIPLALSAREFDLFSFLLKHPERAFTREELLGSVWGWSYGDLSTVTVTMRRLREKVEDDPTHPLILQTVWGVGYRLVPDGAG